MKRNPGIIAALFALAVLLRCGQAGAPPLATLSYDATALASLLARMEGGADFSSNAITSPSGFAGTGGIFRFLPDGQSQRRLAIMEVRPNRVRVLSPSLQSFRDLTN